MAMDPKTKKRVNNFVVVPVVVLISGLIRAVVVNMFVRVLAYS